MQIFALLRVSRPVELRAAILQRFPQDHFDLGNNEWFVAVESMTSREVCDALGVSEGQNGNAVAVGISGYWGRTSNDVWEWLAAKRGQTGG
jgi:hypothetical protein